MRSLARDHQAERLRRYRCDWGVVMPLERLGKYEIRRLIGRGTMGTVYEGWDPFISRRVAIKTVRLPEAGGREERDEIERFRQEAQSAGRLQHPNIVGVFDYGETDELAYIVMEFVDGRTLKALLDDGMQPDLSEIGRLMDGLLTGLEYSHNNQVIHRDIKPANVIVTTAGAVKIADFGIARIAGSTMTHAGTIMGTPAYMSPEQFQGHEIDARTDVYSAGVVLFQLLTGKRPFEGSMATIMHAVLNNRTPRPSELSQAIPEALDAVVSRAMARSVDDRYPSAVALNQALHAALETPSLPAGLGDLLGEEETVVATPRRVTSPPATLDRPDVGEGTARRPRAAPTQQPSTALSADRPSRAPLMLAIAAVVLLLAGGGGWWIMFGGTAARSPIQAVITEPKPSPQPTASTDPPPPPPDAEPRAQATSTAAPAPVTPTPAPNAAEAPTATTEQPRQPPPAAEPATAAPAARSVAIASTAGPLDAAALRRALATAARNASCQVVRADGGADTTPTLRGVVGRGAGESSLHAAVQQVAGDAAVNWEVTPTEPAYCGVLDLIRPYVAAPDGTASGITVALAQERTDLTADELIIPHLTMPDFAGVLQLDYISGDGTVVHLHQALAGGSYAAGSARTFGEPAPPEFAGWAVDRPFGADVIVAIASSVPLFRAPRPAQEKRETYLRDLGSALSQASIAGARIAATVLAVRTRPRS